MRISLKTSRRLVEAFALLALATFIVALAPSAQAACGCGPTAPSCAPAACGVLSITTAAAAGGNTSCPSVGADCTSSCAANDTLDGTAIVTWTPATNPTLCGCNGAQRSIVICDSWLDCDSNITHCTQCTTFNPACNVLTSTTIVNNNCATLGSGYVSGDRWTHVIVARDITGTGCASSCPSACTDACVPNCTIQARSCCLTEL